MKIVVVFTILIAFLYASCYKESEYHKPFDPSSFSLNVSADEILADGVASQVIKVEIPSEADDSLLQVTFKTSAGSFAENSEKTFTTKAKKVDGLTVRIAEATLKSTTKVEFAVINVEFFDNKRSDTIRFINAFPVSIKLTASLFKVKPENGNEGEVTVDAQAVRTPGTVSQGNIVTLMAFDSLFAGTIGSLRVNNNITGENGKASFTFVLGDSVANQMSRPYIGRLYLVGSARNQNAELIHDTLQIISSR